jgi:uncharacterized membrane protein YcaP (DUF421 family)
MNMSEHEVDTMALDVVDIILRTALAFVLMLAAVRLLGKQMIARMTYFNFVANITLGSLTGAIVLDHNLSLGDLILGIAIFTLITFLASFMSLKNRLISKWIAGHSIELIRDGKILEGELEKARLKLESLIQQLRLRNVFEIDTVQQAFLETNGKLSILLKPEARPLTLGDFQKSMVQKERLPVELIIDGSVIEENLVHGNVKRSWLMSELERRGVVDTKDVAYAVLTSKNKLYVDKYEDQLENTHDTTV